MYSGLTVPPSLLALADEVMNNDPFLLHCMSPLLMLWTAPQWLELLKEIAPSVARVAVIYDPTDFNSKHMQEIEAVIASFGVRLSSFIIRNVSDIERAITVLTNLGPLCLICGLTGADTLRRKSMSGPPERN